ncbi:hypothetical protein KAH94_06110, partial [bacterium]|nr:hypothetical protein [bacterium]
DIEVETGGSLTINKNNIVSDAGGMTINTPTGDTLIHSINGVDNVIFDEDEIGFRTGRAHKISATNTSLQLISEVTADNVEFWTGASRANETIAVQDEETIFKTDATNAVDYEVLIRRSHATTTGQPAIGYYGWEAEDSVNAFSAYAAIVAVIDTDTSTDRNGRLQIVVADGNTAAQRGVTQITGVGLDIQGGGGGVKIGVYGATPVVQPSGTGETTGFTAGAGTGVNDDSTFTGNLGSKAYRINDIVKALKQAGWLVQS